MKLFLQISLLVGVTLLISCKNDPESCEDVDMGFIELTDEANAWVPPAFRIGSSIRFENVDGDMVTLEASFTDEQVRSRNLIVGCEGGTGVSFHAYDAERVDLRYQVVGTDQPFTLEFTVEPFQLEIEGSQIEFVDWIKARADDGITFLDVVQKQIDGRGTGRLVTNSPGHFFEESVELDGKIFTDVLVGFEGNLYVTQQQGIVAVVDKEGVTWTRVE